MLHNVSLRLKDDYREQLESEDYSIDYGVWNDLEALATEINIEDDANKITVVLTKTPLSKWLERFHEQEPDDSGLCQRYRIVAIVSEGV